MVNDLTVQPRVPVSVPQFDIQGRMANFMSTTAPHIGNYDDLKESGAGKSGPKKRRRDRITYSKAQLTELENVFAHNKYPDVFTRKDLAQKINISESRIQVWFKNRRVKARQEEKTSQEIRNPNVTVTYQSQSQPQPYAYHTPLHAPYPTTSVHRSPADVITPASLATSPVMPSALPNAEVPVATSDGTISPNASASYENVTSPTPSCVSGYSSLSSGSPSDSNATWESESYYAAGYGYQGYDSQGYYSNSVPDYTYAQQQPAYQTPTTAHACVSQDASQQFTSAPSHATTDSTNQHSSFNYSTADMVQNGFHGYLYGQGYDVTQQSYATAGTAQYENTAPAQV